MSDRQPPDANDGNENRKPDRNQLPPKNKLTQYLDDKNINVESIRADRRARRAAQSNAPRSGPFYSTGDDEFEEALRVSREESEDANLQHDNQRGGRLSRRPRNVSPPLSSPLSRFPSSTLAHRPAHEPSSRDTFDASLDRGIAQQGQNSRTVLRSSTVQDVLPDSSADLGADIQEAVTAGLNHRESSSQALATAPSLPDLTDVAWQFKSQPPPPDLSPDEGWCLGRNYGHSAPLTDFYDKNGEIKKQCASCRARYKLRSFDKTKSRGNAHMDDEDDEDDEGDGTGDKVCIKSGYYGCGLRKPATQFLDEMSNIWLRCKDCRAKKREQGRKSKANDKSLRASRKRPASELELESQDADVNDVTKRRKQNTDTEPAVNGAALAENEINHDDKHKEQESQLRKVDDETVVTPESGQDSDPSSRSRDRSNLVGIAIPDSFEDALGDNDEGQQMQMAIAASIYTNAQEEASRNYANYEGQQDEERELPGVATPNSQAADHLMNGDEDDEEDGKEEEVPGDERPGNPALDEFSDEDDFWD